MNKPSSHTLHGIIVAATLLLFFACARMGTPDGGPYDETPPKVVSTSPKFAATNVKHAKKITIEFDEIVKIENAMEISRYMPEWPYEGCVQQHDGMIIVKLSAFD